MTSTSTNDEYDFERMCRSCLRESSDLKLILASWNGTNAPSELVEWHDRQDASIRRDAATSTVVVGDDNTAYHELVMACAQVKVSATGMFSERLAKLLSL